MSRILALIATLAILELGISSTPSMSENSSEANVPANSESISEAAEAEQPARLIGDDKAGLPPDREDKVSDAPAAAPDAVVSDRPEAEAGQNGGKRAKAPRKLQAATPKYDDGNEPEAENIESTGENTKVSTENSKASAENNKASAEGSARAGSSAAAKGTSKHSHKTASAKGHKSSKGSDDEETQEDKEAAANSYMAHDDSGFKEDPVQFYQAGLRYIKLKKFQLALNSFTKALEINPRYYEASFSKALVYQLTGYDKYAARRYQDVLRYRPDMDQARINLAALHRKHKHYIGAEEQLEAVIQHNWASFEAHYNLANVFVEDGKFEDALKEYKFCMKLKPRNPNLHNNLGVLFLQKNYPDEALQEFRKAAQLAPGNQMFRNNINTAVKMIAEKKSKGLSM